MPLPPYTEADSVESTNILCPKCRATVGPRVNQCPECGEYFPNALQRQGDVAGGMLCGLVRGIGLAGVVAAGVAVWRLMTEPLSVGAVAILVIGLLVFSVCMTIAGRLDARTYH